MTARRHHRASASPCYCKSNHRTFQGLARCAHPGAIVRGDGPYGVKIDCGATILVLLCDSSSAAVRALTTNCGPDCAGQHALTELAL